MKLNMNLFWRQIKYFPMYRTYDLKMLLLKIYKVVIEKLI